MRLLVAGLMLLTPGLAVAQDAKDAAPITAAPPQQSADAAAADGAPKRIRSVALAVGQQCPKPTADEIIVCSTIEDPYRIPRNLRGSEPTAANRAWTTRNEIADDAQRRAAGLPNTCSPVGAGGQTGCTQQLLEQWSAEQLARRNGVSPP